MPPPTTPTAALAAALALDGARPLVTHYDDDAGTRTELSVRSFDNAVAKTAGLLVDDLDVQPGELVAIDLPLHWQLAVWLGACWAVGAVAAVGGAAREAQVAVVGPEGLAAAGTARDTVAVSLHPLGLPLPGPLPPGVLDHAVAARVHPDVFTAARMPGPGDQALVLASGRVAIQGELLDLGARLADRVGLPPGGRLLSAREPRDDDGVLAVLAVPLAVAGSVVLVHHADRGADTGHAAAERADAVLGPADEWVSGA